uniref:Uncharacterized protein n=1 Tax=Eptatretus burgeri TaxID=7764 RepID=A0A8C4NGI2_EPTBU
MWPCLLPWANEAELSLLMNSNNDPNMMFLTGDTAQCIMRGISFRFNDLCSLFYYAANAKVGSSRVHNVRVPHRIYQLSQNYRSHSGILNLGSSVVDLLIEFFPSSFDRLPPDRGLFHGPRPAILDLCTSEDLAILLRGNRRESQPIEFGAPQVILVANDKAKERLPEELSLGLVLTIYESKGLEFDDVLLYNFFSDSEVSLHFNYFCHFYSKMKAIHFIVS